MGEFKGTPGPWSLECGDHTHRYVRVTGADDLTVFYKYGAGNKADNDRDEINARLIAAAPDMVAVLAELLTEAEDVFVCMADATGIDRHNYPAPYKKARIVLSRALGLEA